jgi:hypothetical protein
MQMAVMMRVAHDDVRLLVAPMSLLSFMLSLSLLSLILLLSSLLSLVVSHLSLDSFLVFGQPVRVMRPGRTIWLATDWLLNPLIDHWIPHPIPSYCFPRLRTNSIVAVPRIGDSLIG